jgi:hypothetical protein
VLDAETRQLLAPRLAQFHKAVGELDASRRKLAESKAELAAHPMAGGLFGSTARRFRDLRRDQRALTADIARQAGYAERLAEDIEQVLHPVLCRKDGHYQRLVATASLFGTAADHCDTLSAHLTAAFAAGRTVTRAAMAKGTGPAEQHQADLAAQRYDDHMREAGTAIAAFPARLTEIEGWVEALIRRTLPPLPMPDLRLFDELPRHLQNNSARLRLAQSLGMLRTLRSQVHTTTVAIRQRQELAEKKRRAALRAAYHEGPPPG